MGWLSRRRHRLGFGIHSPFAYRMVNDIIALNPRYGYYAEKAIAKADSPSPQTTRMAIIVHRLTARYGYALTTEGLCSMTERLMRKSYAKSYPESEGLPELVITSAPLNGDTLIAACRDNVTLLSLAPIGTFTVPVKGILFHDVDASLYFPYAKTAYIAYEISF